MTKLFTPLPLSSGHVLQNRIGKAAMEENMAEYGQLPGEALFNLYTRWANDGPGLIITGNVMVSPDAMTGPGGIYLGKETIADPNTRAKFEQWAKAGKQNGTTLFMQISHPGRQVYATMKTDIVSASNTKVAMDGMMDKMFVPARALSEPEVLAMIERFADTAEAAKIVGFDGVQIHAAHGYLVAQFLSPLTNLRQDKWGGSLENRARFLLEIARAVRARVGKKFGVAVKLNSADFQRGGFAVSDARTVVKWLNDEQIDFVEISGGSYESAAMAGEPIDGEELSSTLSRELYFIDFAKEISPIAKMPLMVTGGVTKKATAELALSEGGVDIVGIARAYGFSDKIVSNWIADRAHEIILPTIKSKNKPIRVLGLMSMTKENLYRMGTDRTPKPSYMVLPTIIRGQIRQMRQTKRYRKWLLSREA